MTQDLVKITKKKAAELLETLSLKGKVSAGENDGNIEISIDTDDSSLLIGYHGENLEAFQLILSFMVSKKLGEFHRVLVNVGDYRQRREEKLKELASRAKEEALQKEGEVVLQSLSAVERRVIHLFLKDDKEVTSESRGEGENRQLIIKPKEKSA